MKTAVKQIKLKTRKILSNNEIPWKNGSPRLRKEMGKNTQVLAKIIQIAIDMK